MAGRCQQRRHQRLCVIQRQRVGPFRKRLSDSGCVVFRTIPTQSLVNDMFSAAVRVAALFAQPASATPQRTRL
jgi:hypothetical protein